MEQDVRVSRVTIEVMIHHARMIPVGLRYPHPNNKLTLIGTRGVVALFLCSKDL